MLNPILASSGLRRMRSGKTLLLLAVYEGVLLLAALGLLLPFLDGSRLNLIGMNQGVTAYLALMLLQFALLVLVTPAASAGAIAGERERQTLELLLVTGTGSFRIVMGKLLESFAFIALMVVCSLPVLCLTMLPGGIGLGEILLGVAFLLVCAFAAASVGVLASTLMKTTVGATILSYVLLLAIGLGTALPVAFITNEMTYHLYDSALYAAMTPMEALALLPKPLLINPGVGLYALLEGQTGMLQNRLASGWGRPYAMCLMLKKLGHTTSTLINMGVMAVLGLLLSGLGAALLRQRPQKKKPL